MPSLGAPELLIILAVVILIFGVGKLPEVGGALGKGIKEFRRSASADDEDEKEAATLASTAAPAATSKPGSTTEPPAEDSKE